MVATGGTMTRNRRTYSPFLLLSALIPKASSRLAAGGRDGMPELEPLTLGSSDEEFHASGQSSFPLPVLADDDDIGAASAPFRETMPPYETTVELLRLSADIYAYRGLSSCEDIVINSGNATKRPLPHDATCHFYEHDEQDTQVLVISRPPPLSYVAVIYAGTDDFRNILTDGNIVFKSFGPKLANGTHPLVPPSNPDIEVHAGFNNAVFRQGLYYRVLSAVTAVLDKHPHYQLLTAGHSLGAANSILTAVALSQSFGPDRNIICINFGCPRTGNRAWRDYANTLPNVGIWRFVNAVDIVPRLPDARFVHVGHTVQMNQKHCRAYWFHYGDADRGLAGVPAGWEIAPFIIIPYNGVDHMIVRYVVYLQDVSSIDRKRFFPSSFRRIDDDDDSTPMDDDFPPGDDDTIGPPVGDYLDDDIHATTLLER